MSATTGRLLDLWLPPDGAGRALGCLATTFTFDADFFEQQCVGRYLGLDTRPGEAASDIGYLIEREEKLAETPVCVIADRSLNPDARSLRWDILGVGAPTGVMHAKVAILVWEHVVRAITSSANLSEHAFRRSIELAVAFDARSGTEVWKTLFDDLFGAVESIVGLAPGAGRTTGPRARALEILGRARDRVASFDLPDRPRRGNPRLAVVMPRPGEDAIDGLMRTWSGRPPRWATVMSPYFDGSDAPSRAAERLVAVLAKRKASVDFIVPVEHMGEREIAQVPRALLDAMPSRIEAGLYDVKQPEPAEPRRLHGKLILLESESWISALVGSSNFSSPGLGLNGGGNVEIGIAIGAPQGSEVAKTLQNLALTGEEVRPEADFIGEEDPEEKVIAIPGGFVQVLGEPGPPASLELELDPPGLPDEWMARTPDGHHLIDVEEWVRGGQELIVRLPAPTGDLPFNVVLQWRASDGRLATASLPVNVTDPGRLAPPEELRALPVDALLRALASLRPLHEAVTEAMRRREQRRGNTLDDLDPLKRFSPSGQLLYRTRELSGALAGLRERLERPAASLDAFTWRIDGPFGPVEIAAKLIEERRNNRSVEGEESFMLAEIALTLASVDLEQASRFIPDQRSRMRRTLRGAITALESRCAALPDAPALEAYVRDAFAMAGR
jgi:phosphatidylserine/phosphatidylglycerophosphate/cardiolipin synthase-like enzyme